MTDRGAASDGQPSAGRAWQLLNARGGLGAALLVFVATFLAYWLLGPQHTAFDFQLSQANNIIHGHLDMTEEHTRNLGILERVLFDGQGFCLPLDDPRGPAAAADIENPRFSADCRHYMQHSLGPAFLLLPLVLIWGLEVNQALISALIGGLTAPIVFLITRRFSDDLRTQLALTALAMFGTIMWWVSANGGVWFFAHTTAVFFLFAAIYATVGLRSPLLAGAFVGAAFMCRPSTIMAGLFPLIAFSDLWLPAAREQATALWRRLRLRPLVALALGVAPFIGLTMLVNALRFGSPFESGYNYTEQLYQISLKWRWPEGFFDISYIGRHLEVVLEQTPVFSTQGSFVWPSWGGLAMWLSTPAFFIGLFVHLRRWRREALLLAAAVTVACAVVLLRGAARQLGGPEWLTGPVPFDLHVLPFWVLVGLAIVAAVGARDRLVVAAWAAIAGIALIVFTFAATGWAQFGYRYGLDFMPFLFLLVVIGVGQRVGRYQLALIGAAILVNVWGYLWTYVFAPLNLFGWTWASF